MAEVFCIYVAISNRCDGRVFFDGKVDESGDRSAKLRLGGIDGICFFDVCSVFSKIIWLFVEAAKSKALEPQAEFEDPRK
jgi:hypothetical protein